MKELKGLILAILILNFLTAPVHAGDLQDELNTIKQIDYKKEKNCSKYKNFSDAFACSFAKELLKNNEKNELGKEKYDQRPPPRISENGPRFDSDDLQDGLDALNRGDYKTALEKLKPLAERGIANAQSSLGAMYAKGVGVLQDYKEAVRWFRLASEQEDALGQALLGIMYDKGLGVLQDYEEAVRLYTLSAEHGNPDAQFQLGLMYDEGRGVKQDHKEAVRLYTLSAEQGNPTAQIMLGLMYDIGDQILQDDIQAHKWFNIAAANGREDGMKNRNDLEKRMTPPQIAEAQKLARDWMEEHGKE